VHGCGGWSRALLLLSGSFRQLERQFLGGRCGAIEALYLLSEQYGLFGLMLRKQSDTD
jgi:hypothetical protein